MTRPDDPSSADAVLGSVMDNADRYDAARLAEQIARARAAAARDPVAHFGHAADGGGAPDELAPICVDELPAAMGFEPRELDEEGGGTVGWQHFANAGDGSDVWLGTLEPSFDVNPLAPFVVVQQQRAGGFWTAIGGRGPEALAAVAAGLPAVPIATLERLGTDARGRGPAPLALLVPGASDNGTRLHGALVAAETWLRARRRADIDAGGHGDYGWSFGRDLPGGPR